MLLEKMIWLRLLIVVVMVVMDCVIWIVKSFMVSWVCGLGFVSNMCMLLWLVILVRFVLWYRLFLSVCVFRCLCFSRYSNVLGLRFLEWVGFGILFSGVSVMVVLWLWLFLMV